MTDATLGAAVSSPAAPAIPSGPDAREDLPPGRPAPRPPGWATPGRCSEHPDLELVRPSRLVVWDPRKSKITCLSAEHDAYTRERCLYCGRNLWADGTAPQGLHLRRRFDSSTCRNYFWRFTMRARRAGR